MKFALPATYRKNPDNTTGGKNCIKSFNNLNADPLRTTPPNDFHNGAVSAGRNGFFGAGAPVADDASSAARVFSNVSRTRASNSLELFFATYGAGGGSKSCISSVAARPAFASTPCFKNGVTQLKKMRESTCASPRPRLPAPIERAVASRASRTVARTHAHRESARRHSEARARRGVPFRIFFVEVFHVITRAAPHTPTRARRRARRR